MNFNKILLFLVFITICSCSENATQITNETEVTEFTPNEEDEPKDNILDDFPMGRVSFSLNGEDDLTIERASAVTSELETIVISEFTDPVTGDPSKLIIGIKGFSEGDFKGNVIGYGLLPSDYDLADITITDYGDVGQAISGSFTVEYDNLGTSTTVSGEFNGLRIN